MAKSVYRVIWGEHEPGAAVGEVTADDFKNGGGERLFSTIEKAGKYQDQITNAIHKLGLYEIYDSVIEKIELDDEDAEWEDCSSERIFDEDLPDG